MSLYVIGICQKRENDRWITIDERPSLLVGGQNRELLTEMIQRMYRVGIEDSAVLELIEVHARYEGWTFNEAYEYHEESDTFGILTLSELIEWNESKVVSSGLKYFIKQLESIWNENPKNFRIVLSFDF